MLKGYRTYIADILLVLVALQGLIPQLHTLPGNVAVVLVSVLGGAVAVFRFLATVSE